MGIRLQNGHIITRSNFPHITLLARYSHCQLVAVRCWELSGWDDGRQNAIGTEPTESMQTKRTTSSRRRHLYIETRLICFLLWTTFILGFSSATFTGVLLFSKCFLPVLNLRVHSRHAVRCYDAPQNLTTFQTLR